MASFKAVKSKREAYSYHFKLNLKSDNQIKHKDLKQHQICIFKPL